jgi:hypothetical protein
VQGEGRRAKVNIDHAVQQGNGKNTNLDDLGETVPDLSDGESLEEVEVEEGVHGSVVGTESVLELLVVDSDLDRNGGIDETDEGSWRGSEGEKNR